MNLVRVDESNYDRLHAEWVSATKDFLYMLFDIAGDCQPFGDWDRAELGAVDPFQYLDIAYDGDCPFWSGPTLHFLHRSAALNLLCRLASIGLEDECSGSTWMADFRSRRSQPAIEALIREYHPELFRILEAFEAGRVVPHPVIQRAFRAALYGSDDFLDALRSVTSEIVLRTFDALFAGEELAWPGSTSARPLAATDLDHRDT